MQGLIYVVALSWTAAALTGLPASQAMAAQQAGDTGGKSKPEGAAPKTTQSSKSQKGASTPPGGSAESPADRAARLKRECRGAVNAGACTGYAP